MNYNVQDTTQWQGLINAILSLSPVSSDISSSDVENLSDVTGDSVTEALNILNSNLNNISETSITTLTEYSGIFFKNKIYKKSNVVYIDLEIVDTDNKISLYNQLVQIGSLPIDYAPKTRTYIPLTMLNIYTAEYITTGSLSLEVNGKVSIVIPRNCSFGYCQATYIV